MSDNESEVTWYIARDGQQHGPLSDAEMRLFVAGGHLRQNDLVWKPGFTDWRPAQTVFPPQTAAPPAPPLPPRQPSAGPTASSAASTRPSNERSDNQDRKALSASEANPGAQGPSGARASQAGPGQSAEPQLTAGNRTQNQTGPTGARPGASRPNNSSRDHPGPDLSGPDHPGPERSPRDPSRRDASRFDPALSAPAGGSPSRGEPRFEPHLRPAGTQSGSQASAQASTQASTQASPTADAGRIAPGFSANPQSAGGRSPGRENTISLDHGFDDRGKQNHDDYDDAYETVDERRSSSGGFRRLATAAVILAVLGGVGYAAFENRETVGSWLEAATQATTGGTMSAADTPVVLAPPSPPTPQEATREADAAPQETAAARLEPPRQPSPAFQVPSGPKMEGLVVTMPPPQPAAPSAALNGTNETDTATATPDVIDANFQKSELWALMKREFPDWYGQRVEEVAAKSAGNQATDVSGYLINELVALRRKHANEALSASNDKLRDVAKAFLVNLKNLSTHSTDTCFEFISKGESSQTVIELFPREAYGNTIQAQIAAVFEAVAEGRKTPVAREAAQKPDYDLLAKELGRIGWTQDDLKLFANPKALSEAPRERVCKMVQDWFQAHIDIQDRSVQERLLFVTLRPVIAG